MDGVGIVVADAAVQYKSEAFHGEILVFEMALDDFNKYGCDLRGAPPTRPAAAKGPGQDWDHLRLPAAQSGAGARGLRREDRAPA